MSCRGVPVDDVTKEERRIFNACCVKKGNRKFFLVNARVELRLDFLKSTFAREFDSNIKILEVTKFNRKYQNEQKGWQTCGFFFFL